MTPLPTSLLRCLTATPCILLYTCGRHAPAASRQLKADTVQNRVSVATKLACLTVTLCPAWHCYCRYFYSTLVAINLATSFASTLCFTALGSLFNKVSDPDMVRARGLWF